MMNNNDYTKLVKIRSLLKEAYDHYFDNSDGHCKSGDGHISLEFGNYWDDKKCEMNIKSVNIYSYVFGSGRVHYFDSIDKALQAVVRWHKEEMQHDYEKDRLAEEKYWNDYFKKHPDKKLELINPDKNVTITQDDMSDSFEKMWASRKSNIKKI